jgi:hypothetical protein
MVIPEVERKSLDFYELKEMIAKLGEISKQLEMGNWHWRWDLLDRKTDTY